MPTGRGPEGLLIECNVAPLSIVWRADHPNIFRGADDTRGPSRGVKLYEIQGRVHTMEMRMHGKCRVAERLNVDDGSAVTA